MKRRLDTGDSADLYNIFRLPVGSGQVTNM
jgi:hypothetical protein